uniref:Plastid lipid-associated protein/fibrillin conserved domain-containing protein n=1 Tax=Oryza punctata TaxID=4537 RepID=A0A0E0MB51_ORYPU
MAPPVFAAASHASLLLPTIHCPPGSRRPFRLPLRGRRPPVAAAAASGVPDEWGDRSPSTPEPPSQPDPPIDDDEWGREDPSASGNSRPVPVTDEWGEPGVPEPQSTSAADPPTNDDEWGGDPAPPPPPPPAPEDDEEERREELKRCLVDTVYGSDLGFRASSEVRGEVLELVTQLEATNPTPEPVQATHLLHGNWILIYTAYSELLPILAVGATPLFKVDKISQEIDTNSMTIVNASTISTPFASFSFSATASFDVQSPSRIEKWNSVSNTNVKVQFKEGSFQPPKISSSVDLPAQVDIFGQKISLGPVQQVLNPVQQAFASIAGSISGQPPLKLPIPGNNRARSWLLTTYLDKDLRISRGDGGLFILVKEGSPLLDQL